MGEEAIREMEERYFTKTSDLRPNVYLRLTDNWIELTLRFIAPTHGIRDLKNAMSREILDALDKAKIGIASSTYDVVGMPPLQVHLSTENGQGHGTTADLPATSRVSGPGTSV